MLLLEFEAVYAPLREIMQPTFLFQHWGLLEGAVLRPRCPKLCWTWILGYSGTTQATQNLAVRRDAGSPSVVCACTARKSDAWGLCFSMPNLPSCQMPDHREAL